MITYKEPTKKQQARGLELVVMIDGKVFGEIIWVGSGFAYLPKGGTFGDIFERVSEVKNSLE